MESADDPESMETESPIAVPTATEDPAAESYPNDDEEEEQPADATDDLSQETMDDLDEEDGAVAMEEEEEAIDVGVNVQGEEEPAVEEQHEVVAELAQEEDLEEGNQEQPDLSPKPEEPELEDDMQSEPRQAQEVAYSTRGRAAEADPLERLAREALGDMGRSGDELSAIAASSTGGVRETFLSDSLTEEERRTRTRYLPEVAGMHMLRKHEIKGDLALARAIHSSTGVATTLAKSKRSVKRTEEMGTNSNSDGDGSNNAMMLDDEGVQPSEDERMSDIVRLGGKSVEIGPTELILPSPVFVAPSLEQMGEKSGTKRSPREVEAVTAFNPPRPPESVGSKKKHRMLRWERRPADIEVDLNNYRKTVQRTQDELRNAQAERERIETVENHLRLHFLHHIRNMNEEITGLNRELATVQQECTNAADLLTSRTRSRGAGKGNYAMRDVLNVLRARGAEILAKGLSFDGGKLPKPMEAVKGAGGVGIMSLQDWDSSSVINPKRIAEAWIVPGDKVQTPYGEGTVAAFYPPSSLDVEAAPNKALQGSKKAEKKADTDAMEVDTPVDASGEGTDAKSEGGSGGKKDSVPDSKKKKKERSIAEPLEESSNSALNDIIAPRVAVKLPFGVGFFPLESLKTNEDPSTYSDERLALRWKGLYETAKAVAPTLDIEAMASVLEENPMESAMELLDESGVVKAADSAVASRKRRLLPFGAEMLPSVDGRGGLLLSASLEDLDKALDTPLYDGGGVLGFRDNPSVPRQWSEMEKLREEKLTLQAKALQLRNKLYRQRRIRLLNERTLTTTQERAVRVESLVAEMRADLKSLKSRLDEEIRELGVSEEEAERILSSFYKSLASQHAGEASPPKRPRRHSELEYPDEEEMGGEDQQGDAAMAEEGEVDTSTQ